MKKVDEQRKTKLVAETIFGICLVGAIITILIGTVIVTSVNSVNPFYSDISTIIMGLGCLAAGVVLAIISVSIKGAQSLSQTARAKREYEEQKAAKIQQQ